MARALTTSEAVARLLELGFRKGNTNHIEDNEFTLPFGKTDYYMKEITNMFDRNKEYRWWQSVGTFYGVYIYESYNGKSTLHITKYEENSGRSICNYDKLPASGKKKFMEIMEEVATRKVMYSLPKSNLQPFPMWGNALPSKLVELQTTK